MSAVKRTGPISGMPLGSLVEFPGNRECYWRVIEYRNEHDKRPPGAFVNRVHVAAVARDPKNRVGAGMWYAHAPAGDIATLVEAPAGYTIEEEKKMEYNYELKVGDKVQLGTVPPGTQVYTSGVSLTVKGPSTNPVRKSAAGVVGIDYVRTAAGYEGWDRPDLVVKVEMLPKYQIYSLADLQPIKAHVKAAAYVRGGDFKPKDGYAALNTLNLTGALSGWYLSGANQMKCWGPYGFMIAERADIEQARAKLAAALTPLPPPELTVAEPYQAPHRPRFWLVWNPGNPQAPTKRYASLAQAHAVAKSMAEKNPGETFYPLAEAGEGYVVQEVEEQVVTVKKVAKQKRI